MAGADSGHHRARVAGTVSAVDTAAGTLTITPRHAGAVVLETNAQTRLTLDGAPAKLADIPVGAAARAVYDAATKVAMRVDALSQHPLAAVKGKVTAVTGSSITIAPEDGGSPVTLGTAASTKVFLDGAPGTLSAITVGDQAGALYDSATLVAAVIRAQSPHHEPAEVEGQVTAVTASSITIAPEDGGSPVTLGTAASTKIFLDGAPGTLSAIAVGDKARAVYDSATLIAVIIAAESPHHELAEVEGQVTAVAASSITIAPEEEGSPVTLATTSSTQIFLDGKVSTLSAIAVGDSARALYDSSTLNAFAIQAESPSAP